VLHKNVINTAKSCIQLKLECTASHWYRLKSTVDTCHLNVPSGYHPEMYNGVQRLS